MIDVTLGTVGIGFQDEPNAIFQGRLLRFIRARSAGGHQVLGIRQLVGTDCSVTTCDEDEVSMKS